MTTPTAGRLHGLDALRAGALLLGVVLHSTMPFLLPPGLWAVGTTQPNMLLGWLTFYLHAFRLELFFVLAGFFGALVVSRRGAAAYARDRAIRILLVFAVALYPMKVAVTSLWVIGGQSTGWLPVAPGAPAQPWYAIAMEWMASESWPAISLTHLWFLYVLAVIVALFLGARALLGRATLPSALSGIDAVLTRVMSSRWAPLVLALTTTPLLAQIHRPPAGRRRPAGVDGRHGTALVDPGTDRQRGDGRRSAGRLSRERALHLGRGMAQRPPRSAVRAREPRCQGLASRRLEA